MNADTVCTRPLLRYHGGKWLLGPWIISQFPEHTVYVESFGGAGSVLLRKARSFAEIYNDMDGEIVSLFRVARDRGAELVRVLELTPFARDEFNAAYESTDDELERARRTVIRSYMGFGSDGVHSKHRTGFRSKSKRAGTTPAHDWASFPDGLRLIIERLRGLVIENKNALEVIEKYDDADTLHYVDPPYPHSTRVRVDASRSYRHEMSDDDHRALAGLLNRVRGSVVLSGYACDLYDQELYAGWDRVEKTGPFGDGALQRTEVIWTRNVDHGLFNPALPSRLKRE